MPAASAAQPAMASLSAHLLRIFLRDDRVAKHADAIDTDAYGVPGARPKRRPPAGTARARHQNVARLERRPRRTVCDLRGNVETKRVRIRALSHPAIEPRVQAKAGRDGLAIDGHDPRSERGYPME